MKKQVLLAINMEAPARWAASYAVQLAARLGLSLAVMAVFPAKPGNLANGRFLRRSWRKTPDCGWERSGSAASGKGSPWKFSYPQGRYEEVLRFSNSQSSVQFIIMGVAGDFPTRGWNVRPF